LSWRVEPLWKGDVGYIIGGGTSLLEQNLELLKDRNVIAINSSYVAVPWAQYVVFADMRWFLHHRKALMNFGGKIISCSTSATGPPQILTMIRKTTPGLATDTHTLMVKNTTLTAAMNLAVHLGVAKIVLLGIDQKAGPDGKIHHHPPHPWKPTADCWRRQQTDLPKAAEDLTQMNIECVNASPGSALTLWPIVRLEDHVAAADPIASIAGVA
jgi:hypothetical protein